MKKYLYNILFIPMMLLVILLGGCADMDYEKILINELSSNFSISDSKFGKKIEDTYKKYKQNDEISAIYFYYEAKYYQVEANQFDSTINYTIYSQLYLRQVSYSYSGTMSKDIYAFGISLFGSEEEWNKQTKYYESKYGKLTQGDKKMIINYIKNRYEYYEDKYGFSVDDKYSHTVFTETANKYGFLYEEINMLWWDYCLNLNEYL